MGKRIADGKSKGGAAAASADNDGDVAAVMEVDNVVMRIGDDETSTGWCFAVTSLFSPPGQRKSRTPVHTEVCRLDLHES